MGEIRLDGLRKEFGDLTAVDSVDLTIPDGSYTMILGPSGCGKSTTLRMIAGLERPTNGDVLIDGNPVTDYPPRERNLSMVFQNLALWDHKTVRENIGFGLRMDDVPEAERAERVDEIASVLHIEDKLDRSPAELSGGQQQRVALGRSLVREPAVVLLDEPLSSLDAKLRLEMRSELSRIQQRIGTTFVHVTHNQQDAMSVADRIVLLNDGSVQQFGEPADLFHAPNNEFVADFVGTPGMNLLDATVGSEDRDRIDIGDLSLRSPVTLNGETDAGHLRVGIRPSDVRLARDDVDGRQSQRFDATVSMVETLGDTNWYYLEAGADEPLVMKSADETVIETVEAGDEITLQVRPEDVHLFDPTDGEALV